jgi:DEAD/DEAH box helicase domain-containing protein
MDLADRVMGYRAGYTPEDRRDIERRMFTGELLGIVATNALELGVDIGSLDAVVHMGFPMTLASYRQQSGRAGRREKDSVSILVADGEDVQDQFYVEHPEVLFDSTQYDVIRLDITHPSVLEAHLQCAAAEQPILLHDLQTVFGELPQTSSEAYDGDIEDVLSHKDVTVLPNKIQKLVKSADTPDADTKSLKVQSPGNPSSEIVETPSHTTSHITTTDRLLQIAATHLLFDPKHHVFFPGLRYNGHPAPHYSIRAINEEEAFRVVDVTTMKVVEEIEYERVPFTLYEGAIFIHQGESFLVFDLNMEKRYAKVRPTHVQYVTAVRDYSNVDPIKTLQAIPLHGNTSDTNGVPVVKMGTMQSKIVCFGYFKLDPRSKVILDTVYHGGMGGGHDIKEAALIRDGQGLWIDLEMALVSRLVNKLEMLRRGRPGTQKLVQVEFIVHTAEHALLGVWPCYCREDGTSKIGQKPKEKEGKDRIVEGQQQQQVKILKQMEVRTECKYPDAKRHRPPRVVLYQNTKGAQKGSGPIFPYFHRVPELLRQGLHILEGCGCEEGCVGCISKVACKDSMCYKAFDKEGGMVLLRMLLGLE